MRSRLLFVLTLLPALVVASVGCGDPPSDLDAGSDAPRSITPVPPTPPSPPALPVLTPCPSGWREVAVEEVTTCEPFGDEVLPSCGPDEIFVHGRAAGSACELASPCPSGAWPDDAPAEAVYVRAGAVDGDGSRDRPFGTLSAAVSAASSAGRPIVIGEGELVGGMQIRGVPSITGLCPSRSRIVDDATTNSAALIVRAGALALRGVHLDGALYGLWLTDGADVTAEGIVAVGVSSAVRLDGGAHLDATRLRASSPRTNDLEDPTLRMGPESSATLRHATLIGGGSLAYGYRRASDPSEVFATLTIEDSTLTEAPVGIAGRLDATLRRTAFDGVGVGVVTISPRTTSLEDVRVRDVTALSDESAFVNAAGGTTSLSRVSIHGVARGTALLVIGSLADDARLLGADVVIAGARGDVVVQASEGATLELARVLVSEADGSAIVIEGSSHAVIEDATLRSVGLGSDGTFGSAVGGLDEGTTIAITRLASRVPAFGIAVLGGARATASDVVIDGGRGIGAQCDPDASCASSEPRLVLDRAEVRDVTRYGLAAIAARIVANDVAIDRVIAPDDAPAPALGLLAYLGAVEGARIRVREVSGLGAVAIGGRLAVQSLDVDTTRLRTCDGCASGSLGDGITCAVEGELALASVRVHGSGRAGISAARGCLTPSFEGGVIEGNGIGVLTDESVEIALFRTLLVRDNGTDYDRVSLSLAPEELGLRDSL
ncbi:MAG: hypothetical protein J0L92_22305 [Deltaproteobacteria bacterium]|nr:hypothetical protein [Deltaproteobacteria bacterium]